MTSIRSMAHEATVSLFEKQSGSWTVKEKHIKKLSKDKKQPIAIISNCGQAGLGKTFLQNFFLCYLIKGKDSFLPDKPISRAFPGRDLNERKNKYVDIYYKPILRNDVFYSVLDLAGDPVIEDADEKKVTRLFSITASISSVIIFSIKADNTIPFETFMKQVVETISKTQCDLQDLIIVYRDWAYASRYEYGWEGGEAYLTYLDSSSNDDVQMQTLLDNARDSFRSVKIFLMPKPCDAISTDPIHFVKDLDPTYLSNLQSLIERVVDEITEPRKFDSEVLQARDLFDVMLDINQSYLDDETETSNTAALLKGKKEDRLYLTMKVAERFYKGKLQKRWKRFSRDSSRQALHAEIKQLVLEKFDADIKEEYLKESDAEQMRSELETLVDEIFNHKKESQNLCAMM